MPPRLCRTCGEPLKRAQLDCKSCALPAAKERFGDVARPGRIASHSKKAEVNRAKTHLRHVAEMKAWDPAALPAWLTEREYREKIQPRLAKLTVPAIAAAIGVSKPHATDICVGKLTNIKVSNKAPSKYLLEIKAKNPNIVKALESHMLTADLLRGDYDKSYDYFISERSGAVLAAIRTNITDARADILNRYNVRTPI